MREKIGFCIALHSHQPVGNFDWVIEDAFNKAYLPFIDVLERHPHIKVILHYSGCLLDWIEANRPDFVKRLVQLVKDGRVEIMSGGYYEPILTMIPERDQVGQITQLSEHVKDVFKYEPSGLWLAERIWEPALPRVLERTGIKYTVVDDAHFRDILSTREVYDYYITEDNGSWVSIFPSSESLRYSIPFHNVDETIDYLRRARSAGAYCVTFADDGEKFGMWPGTNQWVYNEGWLERFFSALEANISWIETKTFSDVMAHETPRKLVYLPCASYSEMMEWSNGYFRNFLLKYPESNNMHKRMWEVSNDVQKAEEGLNGSKAAKPSKKATDNLSQAKRHLYMSQTNCPYWHGVFGGLYLGHLRNSVYHQLITAENHLDAMNGKAKKCLLEQADYDGDGFPEVCMKSFALKVYLDPCDGGAIYEIDYRPQSVNVTNILTRSPESYHQKILEKTDGAQQDGQGPASIHDSMGVKEEGLSSHLFYDKYRRMSLIDHFLRPETTLELFSQSNYDEVGDFIGREYALKTKNTSGARCDFMRKGEIHKEGFLYNVELKKGVALNEKGDTLLGEYEVTNCSEREFSSRFGIEFNLSIHDSRYEEKGQFEGITELELEDPGQKVKLMFTFDKPTDVWYFPVETISESEGGIERTYQGMCLVLHRPLRVNPKGGWKMKFNFTIAG